VSLLGGVGCRERCREGCRAHGLICHWGWLQLPQKQGLLQTWVNYACQTDTSHSRDGLLYVKCLEQWSSRYHLMWTCIGSKSAVGKRVSGWVMPALLSVSFKSLVHIFCVWKIRTWEFRTHWG
jgi:hypothetical protein